MTRVRFMLMVVVAVGVLVLVGGVALAAVTIKGTSKDDHLVGTEADENFIPYGGDDVVETMGGTDTVHHSYGNDTIKGGPGNETLRGGFGNDVIDGSGDPGYKDLIDCAYVEPRENRRATDRAIADKGWDTVVDCKTVDWR
jgi:Ca2+-binding RTX toxin-like protein